MTVLPLGRPLRRLRGLACRQLPPERGLLLQRCRAVHTFAVRAPIDVVFLAEGGLVLDVVRLRPCRVVWRPAARHVLELGAGESARLGLVAGARVAVRGAKIACLRLT